MSDNEIPISARAHYRQRELEKVLAEIENEIAGRNVSFRALITDEKGEVDPKKVDRMIDGMVNNLGNDIYGYSRGVKLSPKMKKNSTDVFCIAVCLVRDPVRQKK